MPKLGSDRLTSLMDYGPARTPRRSTDTNFPYNQICSATCRRRLPEAGGGEAAGITDPNLLQAAIIDYLFTGNPQALTASVNVQQQEGTTATTRRQ